MSIKIVTDSTACLEEHTLRELDIKVVSLSVNFTQATYQETEMNNDEFYRLMEASPTVPTSSQPSPADFHRVFAEFAQDGHDIVGIFISSDLSGTYNSAVAARKMVLEKYPLTRIEIIDSRSSAIQLGFPVMAAAQAALAGQGIEEVLARIQEVMAKSRMYFVPKTLDYLKKGGRIGGAGAIIGTLLQVKPILYVENGKVAVLDKVRTFEKAIFRILDELLVGYRETGIKEVVILNINAWEEAQKIALYLAREYGLKAQINSIGPVVGLHVGPGTLGLGWY